MSRKKKENKENIVFRELKVTKPLMRGEDILNLQNKLIKEKCLRESSASGVYNAETAFAVRKYQALHKLIVTGKVDRYTAQSLGF